MKRAFLCFAMAAAAAVAVAAPGGPVVVTVPDGKDVSVKAAVKTGGVLEVRLASNITTGYSWKAVVGATAVVKQVGEGQYVPPEKPMPGAGGVQVFTFAAAKAGASDIIFQYARPWEKGVAPVRTAKVAVTVSKAPR